MPISYLLHTLMPSRRAVSNLFPFRSDMKCNFHVFILPIKVLECEQITLLKGVALVHTERESVCTREARRTVFS